MLGLVPSIHVFLVDICHAAPKAWILGTRPRMTVLVIERLCLADERRWRANAMVDHYTYRVSWSEEDRQYVGSCAEFPSLSHLAASRGAALRGIEKLVRDVVVDMRSQRKSIPCRVSAARG
jgi:predicted RNase H-like HicB family nuclease